MKAVLEFNLPEEQEDHAYALAGLDALLVINDLENEIRMKLKHNCGEFKEFDIESFDEEGAIMKRKVVGCDDTLEKVWNVLLQYKRNRNIPELL